ncbi:MAG: hypothetical protein CME64_07445 [Halobacteriovoraceae bacterium]|nr:hypothetical protein [Halobacteriovoraceae bacterium]|tara:strand:- start:383 stop:754 length:372 start_codon:yes stop_codon:yes gene_type:complete
MRKRILNYYKSNHFKLRQKERILSDQEIKNAIAKGEISTRDERTVFIYKNIEIIADFDSDVLITIVKKPLPPPPPKLLNAELAKNLKKKLEAPEIADEIKSSTPRENEEYEIKLEEYLNQTKK